MLAWKKRIFIRVILVRMEAEQQDRDTILEDYPALTTDEKAELQKEIPTTWQEITMGGGSVK